MAANWLRAHEITLEPGFVESLQALAVEHALKANAFYRLIGCNKTDICRWRSNPCSTHAAVKRAKLSAVRRAEALFGLPPPAAEQLAGRAGLSLCAGGEALHMLLPRGGGPCRAVVSERMLQYYAAGDRVPTKQALLAIALSLQMPRRDLDALLHGFGFCLSASLPNDAVVRWFLQDRPGSLALLYEINEVLEELALPLLMTRQTNFYGYR